MIIETLIVGPFGANCYIVGSPATKRGLIIDPGDEAEAILKTVQRLDLAISFIVVTHVHIDHIGALSPIKQATKAQFLLHEAEKDYLSAGINRMLATFGLESSESPPQPEKLLKDGDLIEVGDLQFKVLHTPGHSPGGVCLYGNDVVFTGDTLFNLGIGRTDFPGGSYKQIIKSINEKLMVLPDETIVYPGHGPSSTIGEERKGNPFIR